MQSSSLSGCAIIYTNLLGNQNAGKLGGQCILKRAVFVPSFRAVSRHNNMKRYWPVSALNGPAVVYLLGIAYADQRTYAYGEH